MSKNIDITALNLMAEESEKQFINYSENLYKMQLNVFAAEVSKNIAQKKIILLAGPSASGKTFTAKLMIQQLQNIGVDAAMISLDNFYKSHDLIYQENQKYDFESLQALDLNKFRKCITQLVENRKTYIPHFDFKIGKCTREDLMILGENQVLIIEGIHALNPSLVPEEYHHNVHRVSIFTDTNYQIKNKTLLTFRDIRLIRRIVRDYQFRHAFVSTTLSMWDDVIAGERRYILPFMHQSDFQIDSTHLYEGMLYWNLLYPLLKNEDHLTVSDKKTMRRLLDGLRPFHKISVKEVPRDSLLMEFVEI